MKHIVLVLVLLALCLSMFAETASAETNIFTISDATLPVELSSFSAVISANNFVSLSWTTQSETGLLGYKVHRSESSTLSQAMQISASLIPATNTSTTQVYSFEDREVAQSTSYYYWLESVEYHSSDFHGPVNVTLNPTDTPELPLQTALQGIYPNPFKHGSVANIQIMVKENENASLAIYNLAGQRVRNYPLGAGNHLLNWDGKDHKGQTCSSGIYFVKLSSGSINQSAKLMLIK